VPLKLGVLDLCLTGDHVSQVDALLGAIDCARFADERGFTRYWLAEHHSPMSAHSSPDLLTPIIAGSTDHIRVGPAGILLKFYKPVKIAKDFRLIHAFFPERIDLGVAGGLVGHEITTKALAPDLPPPAEQGEFHLRNVDELVAHLRGTSEALVTPNLGAPEIWILGSGNMPSALRAAQHGACYSTSLCFMGGNKTPDSLRAYRERFQPSEYLAEPRFNIAVAGACADSEAEARAAIGPAYGAFDPVVVGSPAHCARQITDLARTFETDEVIFLDLCGKLEDRRRSYEMLADVLGVEPR
jgi:luciferase family oxidoreductase group 1